MLAAVLSRPIQAIKKGIADYEKEQLVLEFYNVSKGVDYTKAAKINFLKQKTVLNESQKQKIKIK